MSVWFTSDPHFGHAKIAETRGFPTVFDHDSAVIASILTRVQHGDQLWILGDLSAGGRAAEDRALELLATVDADLHLIAGNHDSCHSMHRDAHKHQRRFLEVFTSVQTFARRRVAGRNVMLSHFPYVGDHTSIDRATEYRLRDEGMWLLHGHTHSSKMLTFGQVTLGFDGEDIVHLPPKQIHVGWDAWKRPVGLDEIAALFEQEEVRP
ncbi:metallophosphoesterase family protein [Rhodococcus globerulus]|nr:metallophosphoesterase family protein [Rhodococcus globerulus]